MDIRSQCYIQSDKIVGLSVLKKDFWNVWNMSMVAILVMSSKPVFHSLQSTDGFHLCSSVLICQADFKKISPRCMTRQSHGSES